VCVETYDITKASFDRIEGFFGRIQGSFDRIQGSFVQYHLGVCIVRGYRPKKTE